MTTGMAIAVRGAQRRHRLASGAELRAIDDVTVDFPAGSVTALLGPSGSGKTTLLQLIGAIDKLDAGSIVIDGTVDLAVLDRRALTRYRRSVGFIFQRFNLIPSLTAIDNVIAPVIPYKMPFAPRVRARELLAAVGLAGREEALPSRLSGGQQQRLAIARALIASPRLLVADEPTGNLDSATGQAIAELLLQVRERYGTTIVMATHDERLAAVCDRACSLRDGRLRDRSYAVDS